jgi:hypothetical protein
MNTFEAKIEIIGINPFVFVPDAVLADLFRQAGTDRGKIPVRMSIDGYEFRQTLIRYSGHWRLYLNTPMRKAAKKEVGDTARFALRVDEEQRQIPMPGKFEDALRDHPAAKDVFNQLSPSLQQEICRYLSFLKNEETIDRNVTRAINFLLGKERFIGRDHPRKSRPAENDD